MQLKSGSVAANYRGRACPPRFARVSVHDSVSAEMLQGCPVVTANGDTIGRVEHLMIDLQTHQLRYVLLSGRTRRSAEIAIPWNTLYFDSATARLVFYTWP
ncbi:MAG: hypothetical protein V7606_2860 [Burkholderiales bacterium]|jgi:hypothetical protein|nr:PRC-barrel domain containing protein [Burkholderia sp.]